MIKRGIIYDSNWQKNYGEIIIIASPILIFVYAAGRILGSGLIVAGIAGLILTIQPIISAEIKYRWYQAFGWISTSPGVIEQVQADAQKREQELTQEFAKQAGVPNSTFSLYIPRINAKAQIIENIDSANQKEYMQALKQGIAHARGSVLPGMSGATYLFAHSSDMPFNGAPRNAVFYLLRELEPPKNGKDGDEVYIFFLDKLYKYRVSQKYIVEANDVSWLKEAASGPERLILQTCWPPGTSIKRYIVVAEPVENN